MKDKSVVKNRHFRQKTKILLTVLVMVFGFYALVPKTVSAFSFSMLTPTSLANFKPLAFFSKQTGHFASYNQLPTAEDAEPIKIFAKIPITAYSSEVGQTDSTPFTTASGTTVRRGVVAANFLPIGTHVRFPELYGDEVFIVEDRMNARYDKHFDIWMEETADAKNFGVHWTTVEVF